jgi:hypothetical protein
MGGATMKAASKLLLGLTVVFAVAVLARAEEGEKKEAPKEKVVTLKGTLSCAKCVFKVEVDGEKLKKCATAIQVKRGEKSIIFILNDKGGKEPYHGKVCTKKLPGSVTGVVFKKGTQYYITPKGEDAVKFD